MADVIIAGAGLAGSVSARVLAEKGAHVLVLEERSHIGGNCYDVLSPEGIRVHQYGPHLFHTSNEDVWDFLSRFTQWTPYEHKVKAHINGVNAPLPFNFNSLRVLFSPQEAQKFIDALLGHYAPNTKVAILELKQHPDPLLQKLADFVYEKVFVGYTAKQWGIRPEELDGAVTARVPVFVGEDDRYFNDTFQAVPKEGYAKLFENLLNHPNITIKLATPFALDPASSMRVIYTGMLDRLFDYCYGELPYRSIHLEFETIDKIWFQDAATVNYPNDYDFTRITEFKHIHPAKSQKTVILKEFPCLHVKNETEPYYPFFTQNAQALYACYANHAKQYPGLILLGRLAEYKYYDMDDVVEKALQTAKKVEK